MDWGFNMDTKSTIKECLHKIKAGDDSSILELEFLCYWMNLL